jgi:hypothetical protein
MTGSVFLVYTVTDWGGICVIDSAWTTRTAADTRCHECNNGEQYPRHYGFEVEEVGLDRIGVRAGYGLEATPSNALCVKG